MPPPRPLTHGAVTGAVLGPCGIALDVFVSRHTDTGTQLGSHCAARGRGGIGEGVTVVSEETWHSRVRVKSSSLRDVGPPSPSTAFCTFVCTEPARVGIIKM